tara:strand:+ start:1969 stop:2601 length:633 start_codon:yes stop_codon:yes gene_type:complete
LHRLDKKENEAEENKRILSEWNKRQIRNTYKFTSKIVDNEKFLYFAYGSNMLVEKLKSRCDSGKKITPSENSQHMIREHVFGFYKKSKDGSGKGDIKKTGKFDDKVYGVLFSIDKNQKIRLDQAEGLGYGYEEKSIVVIDEKTGEEKDAKTYFAQNHYSGLTPYDWYKRQTVQGAKDNDLPEKYIEKIEAVPSKSDDDDERRRREERYFK